MDRKKLQEQVGGAAREAGSALKQPEGLATAALGAFLINPVVGLALGIGQGILAKRDRQTALDEAAADRELLQSFDQMHQEAIAQVQGTAATDLDREQLNQLDREYGVMRKLALSSDPDTRRQALTKLAEMTPRIGDWLEDIESRNETIFDRNVETLDQSAVVARQNYERGLAQAQTVQRVSSEFHQLLSDPDFDVNNPVSRARLGQLLEQTPREFLADPADMSDALESVGANVGGIMGGILAFYAGKKKAEEFEFSKEDWRKVAYAMNAAADKQAKQTTSDAERIGLMLDKTAGGINHRPALSYLDRIITGKVQEGPGIAGPGVYDEADRKAASERAAAAAAAEKNQPSKVSKAVSTAKEKATDVITSRWIDPTGFWSGLFGRQKERPDVFTRRPTN